MVVAVTVVWLHRASGQDAGRPGAAGMGMAPATSAVAAIWFDGTRLRTGDISLNGRVTQRPGPEASAGRTTLARSEQRFEIWR